MLGMCYRITTWTCSLAILFLFVALLETSLSAAEPVLALAEYSICKTWQEVVERDDLHYASVVRISDPGTKDRPAYTGFWFYDGLQFDESGRYALAMKVDFKERD